MKADPDGKAMPCLLSEKSVEIMWCTNHTNQDIEKTSYDRGVECSTRGNFGSQVHDESGVLSFLICDHCVIRKSHLMIMRDFYGSNEIINARDYFEHWKNGMLNVEKDEELDSYLSRILPYFEE